MKGFLSACDRAVGISDEKGWKPLVYLISTRMCVCVLIKHVFTVMKGMQL